MLWVVVWVLLGLGACGILFLLGRRLWRQLDELTRELRTASDALRAVTDRIAELERRDVPGDHAHR
jgi:hypothetical protein